MPDEVALPVDEDTSREAPQEANCSFLRKRRRGLVNIVLPTTVMAALVFVVVLGCLMPLGNRKIRVKMQEKLLTFLKVDLLQCVRNTRRILF